MKNNTTNDYRLPISQEQLDKHNLLNKKFGTNISLGFYGYNVVPQDKAVNIGAQYGSMFVCICPDGSSHT